MRALGMLAGVAVLALGIGVLPAVAPAPAGAADIDEKIASARTPADHEAIAGWYDDQAKEARAKAEEHRRMGEAYKKAGGPFASKTHFHEHCEALTKRFSADADEYEALAAAHRAMAKGGK